MRPTVFQIKTFLVIDSQDKQVYDYNRYWGKFYFHLRSFYVGVEKAQKIFQRQNH